jgi:transposase InsO family protein
MATPQPKSSGATPPREPTGKSPPPEKPGPSDDPDGKKPLLRGFPSKSPPRQPRSRYRDADKPRERVVERVVCDSGSTGTWPQLTKTNYVEWSLRVKLKLQARDLWDVVEYGDGDFRDDRTALDAICSVVPSKMIPALVVKETATEAWEAIRTLCLGGERRRAVTAQTLRTEYESMKIRGDEAIEDFTLRFTGVLQCLADLGDPEPDVKVIKKFLCVVRPRYKQLVVSMEAFVDLSKLSIEELAGTLKSANEVEEEAPPSSNKPTEKLLLTHEEWLGRYKPHADGGRGGSTSGGRGKGRRRGGKPRGHGGGSNVSNSGSSSGRAGADDTCKRCGKKGHWAQHCRRKLKAEESAHVAQEEEQTLLLSVGVDQEEPDPQIEPPLPFIPAAPPVIDSNGELHLLENKVLAAFDDSGDRDPRRWVLDTGASNHMTGSRAAFSRIDAGVTGTVRFGDSSVARIEGVGTLLLACKSGEHRALHHVYYLPRLTANIISVGQLDERGYQVLVEDGVMRVRDEDRRLLAKINRNAGRLYVLDVDIAQPVCLAMRGEEEAWVWHARIGHLHFAALHKMGCDGLVKGMPLLSQVEQVCEACLAGKHRRSPFPHQAQRRATEVLHLLHGDICGPITPPTPSGNRYFLLLVDDYSRYMWICLLSTKDVAADAIKRVQAAAERKTGKKLQALRTARGGEFAATDFVKYCVELGVHRQLTASCSPQQNGVVERCNQTVVGTREEYDEGQGSSGSILGEAVTSKSVQGKTPYELWTGSTPGVQHLRTFGCIAHIKTTTPHLKKLDDRSRRMIFVGYEPGSMAYRAYDPVAERVTISRDVVFDEAAQWSWTSSDDTRPSDFTIEGQSNMPPEVIITTASTSAQAGTPGTPTTTSPAPAFTPHAPGSPTPSTPATSRAATPASTAFLSPPSSSFSEHLDADHDDDVPLRFRPIDTVIGAATPPGLEDR